MSFVPYKYGKIMEIKLKNGISFLFGAKQFDRFFEKLNSLIKNVRENFVCSECE